MITTTDLKTSLRVVAGWYRELLTDGNGFCPREIELIPLRDNVPRITIIKIQQDTTFDSFSKKKKILHLI